MLIMPILLKKPKQKKHIGEGFEPKVDENGDVWQRTIGQVPPWLK